MRRLDGQPDYNRVWPGCERSYRPEYADDASQVVEAMRARGVFASIDIHNNTGLNPALRLRQPPGTALAASGHAVFAHRRLVHAALAGAQTTAFCRVLPGFDDRVRQARQGGQRGACRRASWKACLHLSEFPAHAVALHDIDLFHTVATVKVPEHVSFGFNATEADINFVPELDHFNFRELDQGIHLGRVRQDGSARLLVVNENGEDIGDRMFDYQRGEIALKQRLMPAMLTRDERATVRTAVLSDGTA